MCIVYGLVLVKMAPYAVPEEDLAFELFPALTRVLVRLSWLLPWVLGTVVWLLMTAAVGGCWEGDRMAPLLEAVN